MSISPASTIVRRAAARIRKTRPGSGTGSPLPTNSGGQKVPATIGMFVAMTAPVIVAGSEDHRNRIRWITLPPQQLIVRRVRFRHAEKPSRVVRPNIRSSAARRSSILTSASIMACPICRARSSARWAAVSTAGVVNHLTGRLEAPLGSGCSAAAADMRPALWAAEFPQRGRRPSLRPAMLFAGVRYPVPSAALPEIWRWPAAQVRRQAVGDFPLCGFRSPRRRGLPLWRPPLRMAPRRAHRGSSPRGHTRNPQLLRIWPSRLRPPHATSNCMYKWQVRSLTQGQLAFLQVAQLP